MHPMKRLIPIFAAIILISANTQAQNYAPVGTSILDQLQQTNQGCGVVKITQNQHITQLLNDRLWQNTKNPGMQGFRIRIFSETGQTARERSNVAMYSFSEKYPGVKFYQKYENPYWKISVGDFRSKESAQKFYKQVLQDFPKAFLVPDWINFPTLE